MTNADAIIVLAAGRGSRLSDQTREVPKWLVEVGGKSIAERQCEAIGARWLERCKHSIVVTGYASSAVTQATKKLPHQFEVLHNDEWENCNNWFSLRLALRHLRRRSYEGDVVVLNSDLLMVPATIAPLLDSGTLDSDDVVLLVQPNDDPTDEAMKVRTVGDQVVAIGKVEVDMPTGEYTGAAKISEAGAIRVLGHLDALEEQGALNSWYEHAFAALIAENRASGNNSGVRAVNSGSASWVEIDDDADYRRANALFR